MPLGYNGFTQETENAAALTLGRNGFVQPVAGPGGAETVTSLTVTGLTASRLVATDGTKTLASVANLASWVAGTTNQVTVTDDGDGTITLALATNLYSDGANIAAFKSGSAAQEARVYGDASLYVSLRHVGAAGAVLDTSGARPLYVGTQGAAALNFIMANATRWSVTTSGHFSPSSDITYDVGGVGATPRDVYAGRQFLGANGSVTAPGWSFSAAPTEGVARISAGKWAWINSSGERFTIDAAGAVVMLTSGSSLSWSPQSYNDGQTADLSLSRVSAGVGKVTNGSSACEWRVHGDATKYATISHNGTDTIIGGNSGRTYLSSANSVRWAIETTGQLNPNGDNTIDLADAAARIRTGYFGTALVVGTNPASAGAVRLANAAEVNFRNAANSTDFVLIASDSSNNVLIGSSGVNGIAIRKTVTMDDAANFIINATTGTKIGTATTQKLGFWNATPVVQQVGGVTLTNNVTAGGTTNQLDDFTSLTVYATDAAAIRNNIYQLGRKVKLLTDALRTIGGLQNADA